MIYVYAIVDDPELAVADLTGLDGSPLIRFSRGRVAAICTVHDDLTLEAGTATLWHQERVIAALMQRSTVAPVRFGTMLADVEHLAHVLASQESRLATVFPLLRGRVELALRGSGPPAADCESTGPPAPTPQPGSGRDYLIALRDARTRQSGPGLGAALADVHATLGELAHRSTQRPAADGALVAAYLVGVEGVDCFRRAVAGLSDRHRDVRLSLTGPWAPFSFLGEETGVACA